MNQVIDLSKDLAAIVRSAAGDDDLSDRLDAFLVRQQAGLLGPLFSDMARLWGRWRLDQDHSQLRDLADRLEELNAVERVGEARRLLGEVVGRTPDATVVLLAGLGGPEGYSRFDRGRDTVFVGLDHPSVDRHADHLEIILAHELVHSLRDPHPAVLAGYGGWPTMTHDDFVERYTFAEHLVSESLATALSEKAFPGRTESSYTYLADAEQAWCEAHRAEIAGRLLQALERDEHYRTFYAPNAIVPGSPDCCDYYFALHFGRSALSRAKAADLLAMPAEDILRAHLADFLAEFLPDSGPLRPEVFRVGTGSPAKPDPDVAIDSSVLPPEVTSLQADLASAVTPSVGREIQATLQAAVAGAGLTWADEAHDVLASPLAFSRDELAYIRWASEGFMAVVETAIELYRQDPEVRAFFGFPEHVERLTLLDPGYRPFVPMGRLDSYWNGRRLRFLELNANGTAGLPLAEQLPRLLLADERVADVLTEPAARVSPLRQRLLDALLEAWRQARGTDRPELVAIVDWSGLSSTSEQLLIARWLTDQGLRCVVVDPTDLRRERDGLHCRSGRIDLVYRRLTTLDLIEQAGRLGPLLESASEGEVVVFGSYASDVAHSKKLFALLSSERWRGAFSMAERSIIDACVPWTASLREERVLRGGGVHDLASLAMADRESLVLKPAEGYEGRGVILGAECDEARWREELRRRAGSDHVLQERVAAPVRLLPLPGQTEREGEALHIHLGEFMIGGQLGGLLARASRELVLSPTSEERALPVFLLGH